MLCSRLSLLSLVFLLVAFVNALPILDDVIRLQVRVDPEPSSNPLEWPSSDRLKTALQTQPGQATFWSGTSAQAGAEGHAKARDGKTLEMALHENKLKMPPYIPDSNWDKLRNAVGKKKENPGKELWKDAARTFAEGAKGDVHVIVGKPRRRNSVYTKIEKPILKRNPAVTSITYHLPNGKQKVVHTKARPPTP